MRPAIGSWLLPPLGAAAGLLLAGWPLQAQAPAQVAGRILDATTSAPVAAAEVTLGDEHCSTGPDGRFRFTAVAPGSRTLEVRRIGYAPTRELVEVLPGQETLIDVQLVPVAIQLESLTVTAQAPGTVSLDHAELVRRGSDLAQAIDGWEGIVVRRTGSSGGAAPTLRGGAPDEVLVLLDGFSLNDPLTGRADLSRVATRDIQRATVLPGAQGARVGTRAISGVILLESQAHFEPELFTRASSYGGVEGRAAGSLGPVSASVEAQRYAEDYPYDIPVGSGGGEGLRANAGGYLTQFTVRRAGSVDWQARGNFAHRGLPGIVTNPTPTARADDGMAFLGVRHAGVLSWSGSAEWLGSRVQDPTPPPPYPSYDSRTSGYEFTAGMGYRRSWHPPAWSGDLGLAVDGRYQRFAGDAVRSGAYLLLGSIRTDGVWEKGSGSVWSLAPILRLDQWSGLDAPAASGRLDVGWRRPGTAVTLGMGSGVTVPALLDLFFREGVGVRINPDLRPERVRWEISGNLTQSLGTPGSGATLSLRGYYGRVADMILWTSDFRGIWSPGNFAVVRRGGEASLAIRPVPVLQLEATGGLSRVTYDRPGGAQVAYRPLGTASAATVWSPGQWSLDARWHFVGTRYRDNSGVNALPVINLFDLGLQRAIGALALRGAVSDLTDQRAEFISGYPTPGRTFSLSIDVRLR